VGNIKVPGFSSDCNQRVVPGIEQLANPFQTHPGYFIVDCSADRFLEFGFKMRPRNVQVIQQVLHGQPVTRPIPDFMQSAREQFVGRGNDVRGIPLNDSDRRSAIQKGPGFRSIHHSVQAKTGFVAARQSIWLNAGQLWMAQFRDYFVIIDA
jgi:hypothetical protein